MGLYNNRIVVKVGTSTLTNDAGKSDLRTTDRLVCVLSDIQNMGYEVVLFGCDRRRTEQIKYDLQTGQHAYETGCCCGWTVQSDVSL